MAITCHLPCRTSIITGGGNGVRKAICDNFAEMKVVVHILDMKEGDGFKTASKMTQKQESAFFQTCDVSKYDEVAKVMADNNEINR